MPKTLRSNFPYGSYLWAVRAAQWRALGIDESELEKPKIAIVNSSSNLAICFSHLDGIAAKIKQSIRDAGALPFEIRTAAPSDFITGAGAGAPICWLPATSSPTISKWRSRVPNSMA